MSRTIAAALAFAVATAIVCAQEADLEKAVQEATKAGDLAKAKELCDQWAKAKPDDARPHLVLGRIYVEQNLIDEAIEAFETARELGPQNPEPACEMGRLFLKASMGEEAVAEFRAALELRKDFPPAVKGLAEAEALMAAPYAKGVHIKLGESNVERGLRQKHPQQTRVATIGGRQCRATERARGQFFIVFDVADEYVYDVDLPVRVAIEYYDIGIGRFGMRYDSSDTTAHRHGEWKDSPRITKTNSKTWKTAVISLPDAKFANRFWRSADFTICSEAWAYREDVYISSVRVTRGGLALGVEPKIAVADESSTCTVTARVVDAAGPVGDGAVVRFTTDRGAIVRQVETVAGTAKAILKPGTEPGEAAIAVETAEDKRVVHVPILPGRGRAVRRRVLLDSFGQSEAWRSEARERAQVTLEPGPEGPQGGRPSTRIAYEFSRSGGSAITLRRPMTLPGMPAKIGLWMKMDGSSTRVHAILVDATGQTLFYRVGVVVSEGWRRMEHDMGLAAYSQGGASDQRIHLPVRFEGLEFGKYYDPPGKLSGELCVQDLTVVTDVPQSATAAAHLDVNAADPDGRFNLPGPALVRVGLTNLSDEAGQAGVRWKATNEAGEVVAQGHTDAVDLPPGSYVTRDVPIRVAEPGFYQASFTLDGDDEASVKTVKFMTLRDMPRSILAGQIRRDGRSVVFRLSNRTDATARFSLSYRVLNDRQDALRKGPLGPPNMAVDAGEVVECPLPLDGLPTGPHSVLVLFDMADGQRFTSVLPHEIFPSTIAIAGRTRARDGAPILGASVRVQLIRHPDGHSELPGELVGVWTAASDDTGSFTLEAVPLPPDVDNHRLHFDAVADGFVDKSFDSPSLYSFVPSSQGTHLRSFIPSSTTNANVVTLRMTPGSALTGRVVGPDGEPVAGARVHGLGLRMRGRRVRSVQSYRPRITDGDGRLKFFVTPQTQVDLTLYPSQWAAKRVTLPAGKLDFGDIRLEAGTTVSGTLLDEHGKPAPGRWVAAERTDRRTSSTVSHPVRVAAKTEADGTFTLPPLKGTFTFWAPKAFQLWWTEPAQRSPRPRVVILPQQHSFDGTRERMELELRGVPQVKVAGRLIDPDGSPVKDTIVTLHVNMLGASMMRDFVATDADGRYTFKGIPRGIESLHVSARSIRRTIQGKRAYLRAMPLAHAMGNAARLKRVDHDVLGVDFQYQAYRSSVRSLRVTPRKKPAARGFLDGVAKAVQDAAKRLSQARPLTGRVLDEAGNGVRGAQARVALVRRPDDGQKDKEQLIGLWNVAAGADGKYAVASVHMPQQPQQCCVRVEIVAKGYAKMQREFPLRELLKAGTQALRVPELRLETEGNE